MRLLLEGGTGRWQGFPEASAAFHSSFLLLCLLRSCFRIDRHSSSSRLSVLLFLLFFNHPGLAWPIRPFLLFHFFCLDLPLLLLFPPQYPFCVHIGPVTTLFDDNSLIRPTIILRPSPNPQTPPQNPHPTNAAPPLLPPSSPAQFDLLAPFQKTPFPFRPPHCRLSTRAPLPYPPRLIQTH